MHSKLMKCFSHLKQLSFCTSVISYIKVGNLYKKYTFEIFPLVYGYIKAGRHDLQKKSNKAVEIFKVHPSYAIADTINRYDKDLDNNLLTIVDKVRAKFPKSKVLKFISR